MSLKNLKLVRTLEQIEKVVKENQSLKKDLIPSVRTLASRFHVSTATITRALRILAKKGMLEIHHGQGAWLAGTAPATQRSAAAQPRKSRKRFHTVREIIERDVLWGRFNRTRILPSLKELRMEYGASYITVRKAMDELSNEALIEPYRKTYRIRSAIPQSTLATVLLITAGDEWGGLMFSSPRDYEMVRTLERECMNSHIKLSMIPYLQKYAGPASLDPFARFMREKLQTQTVIGVVICAYRIDKINSVLSILEHFKVPITVFDEMGTTSTEHPTFRTGMAREFTIAFSSSAGKNLGRYLLEMGHRHIAYISAYASDPWSMHRFEGLQAVIAAAKGTVSAFGADVDTRVVFGSDIPRAQRAVARTLRQHEQTHSLLQAPPMYSRDFAISIFNERLNEATRPCFRKALQDRRMTAWVAANDGTALAMLNFLSNANVAVPASLSVVGFDNSNESYNTGLTTYDFNLAGVANAMLAFILHPSSIPILRARHCIEIEGMVVPRLTTGRPRER